jgi:ribosomal subunit interface protein
LRAGFRGPVYLLLRFVKAMSFPLQITFHGVPHSNAIEQYVRGRADKLETFASRIVSCRVAIEMPHRHAHHGEHYRVRIDVTVAGGEIVVERVPQGDHAYEDAYAAIDAAFDDAGRRLQDFVRRQRGDVKPHERARHGLVIKLFAYEGYGFLRTAEGDELYFHRNAVLDGAFDRLKVASRVRFVEDADESGPHASTVAVV